MSNTPSKNSKQKLLSALEWHLSCGADLPISHQPRDWYQPMKTAKPLYNAPAKKPHLQKPVIAIKPPQKPPPAISGSLIAIEEAAKLSRDCNDWQTLITAIQNFTNHPLQSTANHCLTHQGSQTSKIVIMGDAPSKSDDINGALFSAESGILLDNMLASIGLTLHDCLLSNIIYWRPPGGRSLIDNEIEICRPFFEKMLALLTNASLIVCLGNVASKALLAGNKTDAIAENSSYQNQFMKNPVPLISSYHPNFLLKVPEKKRNAWHDLLAIQQIISHNNKSF